MTVAFATTPWRIGTCEVTCPKPAEFLVAGGTLTAPRVTCAFHMEVLTEMHAPHKPRALPALALPFVSPTERAKRLIRADRLRERSIGFERARNADRKKGVDSVHRWIDARVMGRKAWKWGTCTHCGEHKFLAWGVWYMAGAEVTGEEQVCISCGGAAKEIKL